jgi:hypothetical protein
MKGCHWYFPSKQYFLFFIFMCHWVLYCENVPYCRCEGLFMLVLCLWCVYVCARAVGGVSLLMYTAFLEYTQSHSTVAANVNSLVLKAWWWIWNHKKYMNHDWRFHPCFIEESHLRLLSHPTLPSFFTSHHLWLYMLTGKAVSSDFGVYGKAIQCEYHVAAQFFLAILSLSCCRR